MALSQIHTSLSCQSLKEMVFYETFFRADLYHYTGTTKATLRHYYARGLRNENSKNKLSFLFNVFDFKNCSVHTTAK
jgi:hypothetical protein